MTLTITTAKKKKPESLPKVEPVNEIVNLADLTLEQLADRYGELLDKVNAIKMAPEFAQLEEVTKQLQGRLADYEPTDELAIKGNRWLVEVSACARNNRTLVKGAIPMLQKMLGAETFGKIAKVNISDVEKYCTPDQSSNVINEDTGYSTKRKITAKHIGE